MTDGYDVVSCTHCGFAYADTSASQRDYEEFYAHSSKYADGATSTGGGLSVWDARRLRRTARDIARAIPAKSARIVDVGCAGGGLLDALRALGYSDLTGIDPSPACVARVARLPGVHAYAGALEHLPPNLGHFDVVILSHVLEHVLDLRAALSSLGSFLNPQGLLYVETPNAMRYADFVFSPFQDFNTEHINHFSKHGLKSLLRLCGFNPIADGTKEILTAPGMPYPAVFVLASLSSGADPQPMDVRRDQRLKDRLLEYITASRRIMDEIEAQMRRILASRDEVIVWGTGQLSMKLLAETSLGQAKIAAFVDGNPVNQGRLLRGVPILAPSQVEPGSRPILVTSILNYEAIAADIRRLGFANPIVPVRPL